MQICSVFIFQWAFFWHWLLIRQRISWLLILQGSWIASRLKSRKPPIGFIVSCSEYDWTNQYIADVGESLCVQMFFLKKTGGTDTSPDTCCLSSVCWRMRTTTQVLLVWSGHIECWTFVFLQIRFVTAHLPSLFLKGPPPFTCFPDRHARCILYICETFPVPFKLLICSIVTN